jgi:hypothetical protein
VSDVADDSLKAPLARRVPGAARSGPRSTTRPVLPDALLRRMQAAVDAARTTRDREHVQPGRTVDRTADRAVAWANDNPAPVKQTARSGFGEISRPAPVTMPDAAARALAPTPEIAGPGLPVQIWPPVEPSPALTGPPVTSPPVTSPPVTSPAATGPPVTSPPVTSPAATGPVVAIPVQAPQRRTRRRPCRRGPRVAGAAALAVILFTAAVAATLWARASGAASHGSGPNSKASHNTPPSTAPASAPPSNPPARSQSPSPRPASLAASWVASQVSHDVYVACDKAMCDALTAHGFPGRKLQLVRPKSPYPVHAQVVVMTPVLARQFGRSATAKWAPAVLTRIGSGSSAIFIRIVSSKGAAAYNSMLSKDVQQRKASAHQLLVSSHVKASAAARNDLAQGRVDDRLIVVLTALAAVHPIEIVSFGTNFAGASPGIPLRVADLAANDSASGMKWADYLRFLRKELGAQPTTYRPQSDVLAHDGTSKLVFQIEFSAPSPLLIVGP